MISFYVLVLGDPDQRQRTFSSSRLPCVNEILVFPSNTPGGEMQQVLLVAHMNFARNQESSSVVVCRPPSIGSEWYPLIPLIQSMLTDDTDDWRSLN